jgi:hypothetical protein
MPLQNRVHPNGEIVATPERGTMLGNRGGRFHREDKTLGNRRWASHHWICCDLNFKNMHHDQMGQGYTSLFFLDEVTALASGHRPCFFCRRKEAQEFVRLSGMTTDGLDKVLHIERLKMSPSPLRGGIKGGGRATSSGPGNLSRLPATPRDRHPDPPSKGEGEVLANYPSGTMIECEGQPFAIRNNHLLHWSFSGYTQTRRPPLHAKLLTPPSIIAILAKGYQPRWHPSALQWDTP